MTPPEAPHPLHRLWYRRQSTKFNGVSYPVQRAAAAIYTPEGREQTRAPCRFLPRQRPAHPRNPDAARLPLRRRPTTPRTSGPTSDATPGSSSTCCSARPVWSARPAPDSAGAAQGHVRISAFNSRANVETALDRVAAALK